MSAVADSADIPTGTKAFAGFEWLLAGRYLRTRRREGFVSVIAGFSFLGIMLGVATLIIVMSVMNGFRIELLSKIVGVNGHALESPPDLAALWQELRTAAAIEKARCGRACGASGGGVAEPALEPGLCARSDGLRPAVPGAEHRR